MLIWVQGPFFNKMLIWALGPLLNKMLKSRRHVVEKGLGPDSTKC
jgi:hypothetical protein